MSGSEWTSVSVPYLTPRAPGTPDAWTEEARAAGARGTQRVVHAGEVPAPAAVAALLGLGDGDTVVVRRRIIELDGHPTELTDTYYPAAIASGTPLAATGKIRGGAVTLLAALGHTGVRVVETVTAKIPAEEERAHLCLEPGEPVLQLARTTYDAHDRPVQADLMVMPADRHQLRYEIRIG
ncbi:GntR family transcriptional regulator [Streptomyces sp. NPDC048507]|uniref:GntR family transcriptional regulator n=1 Tax=Streptomyces sp. NPDC048507 TaxID=3365560 RepID=UPI003712F47C